MDKDNSDLIKYLDEKFRKAATKDDLDRFATKEDLGGLQRNTQDNFKKSFEIFATKEDLDRFATKEDLNELALKFVTLEEFDQFRTEVRQEFTALRETVQSLTNSVDKLVKAVSEWIQKIAEKTGVQLEY